MKRTGHDAEHVIVYLRMLIATQYGGEQKKCAKAMKVSPQYLCDVLKGRRELGPSILEPLGFAARTVYVRTVPTPCTCHNWRDKELCLRRDECAAVRAFTA